MYIIYPYSDKVGENNYNIRIKKVKKPSFIKKFNLQEKGILKEVWENNVCIVFSNQMKEFHYIQDLNISYDEDKKILIQELNITPCSMYNFYKTDTEETYHLYEGTKYDINIKLKEYADYLILSFETTDLDNFYKEDIFYI